MNIRLIRHGFLLVLLALVTGFLIGQAEIPALALSAHTIGILGGVLLIAVGSVFSQFILSPFQSSVMYFCWLISSYLNWLACFLGALLGTGVATPVVSAGRTGDSFHELMVSSMLIVVVFTSFIAVGLSIWGLREKDE